MFQAQTQDYEKVWTMMQELGEENISDVPMATTLGYHIWGIRQRDWEATQIKWERREQLFLAKKDLHGIRLSQNSTLLMITTVTSDTSFSMTVCSIERYDTPSKPWEAGIVFATCNSLGNKAMAEGFDPRIIYCEEVGQTTIPSLCVPLTSFNHWIALLLSGDSTQLEPICLASGMSEVAKNTRVLPLALLLAKKRRATMLDVQYRMCPATTKFSAEYYYQDKLRKAPSTVVDNPLRQAVRNFSKKYEVGQDGSEYCSVRVARRAAQHKASRCRNMPTWMPFALRLISS